MTTEPNVFISYAEDTKPLARILRQALLDGGYRPWTDFVDLSPGRLWQEELDRALDHAHWLLILVSPTSRLNRWQDAELRAAMVKAWSEPEKRLIPVVIGGDEPPASLRNWGWVNIDPSSDAAAWTGQVIDALHSGQFRTLSKEQRAEHRREWHERLDEIGRRAEESRKLDVSEIPFDRSDS